MTMRLKSAVAFGLVFLAAAAGWGCPLCSAPEQTLAEQFNQMDSAVLGKWTGGEPAKGDKAGTTLYEIVEVARDPLKSLKAGDTLTLPRYRAGKKGDLCLLLGTKGVSIEWVPLDVTAEGYRYIAEAPPPNRPGPERLRYFLKFLENKDPMVAADAYGEFALTAFKDLLAIKADLPHDTLRKWVESQETPGTRLGLYGLMLGICGDDSDATLMEKRIVVPNAELKEYRLGIDGVIGGYLFLTKDKGLEIIEKSKLSDETAPFSETFAALQAVRFMKSYGEGRISEERLKQSLRLLLDRSDMADLVIADLSRWKDWSVQSRLMEMYDSDKFNVPSVKRAIVRYLHECKKDMPKAAVEKPAHVADAEKHLAELRQRDPKLVKDVLQFLQ